MILVAWNWDCPHCDRAQTIAAADTAKRFWHIDIDHMAEGSVGANLLAIRCANNSCAKLTLHVRVGNDFYNKNKGEREFVQDTAPLLSTYLLPQGFAKPQPEYIPETIRQDYLEACLIRDLSPKASATLARRCIQTMIRDFAKLPDRPNLHQEIDALRKAVDDGTAPREVSMASVKAIEHVKNIGNIGAHMQKDVDLIVEVDPGEAQALISLIESLLRDWYVERRMREDRFADVTKIGVAKKDVIDGAKAASGTDDAQADETDA